MNLPRDAMAGNRAPWWKGTRGEWWVAGQGVLFAALALAPVPWSWRVSSSGPTITLGGLLVLLGLGLAARAMAELGPNLTPLPLPRSTGTLVQGGIYARARHPIYGGVIIAALGWALWKGSGLHLLLAAALAFYLIAKARYEERLLLARFTEYRAYRARTKRLIPWVF